MGTKKNLWKLLQRVRDSNPRRLLHLTHFPGVPLQPLEQLSVFDARNLVMQGVKINDILVLEPSERRNSSFICAETLGWKAGVELELSYVLTGRSIFSHCCYL